MDEETILEAKRAVMSVLTEECADHADIIPVCCSVAAATASPRVCRFSSPRQLYSTCLLALAIAKQVLEQLRRRVANVNVNINTTTTANANTSTEKNDKVLHLDAHKVRVCIVLHCMLVFGIAN
jgi:hypothetical protein